MNKCYLNKIVIEIGGFDFSSLLMENIIYKYFVYVILRWYTELRLSEVLHLTS